jgi:hypothetical protein
MMRVGNALKAVDSISYFRTIFLKFLDWEEFYLLGHDAVHSAENQTTFRRNMFSFLGLRNKHVSSMFRIEEKARQETSMRMEATCSSETSVDIQRTTWHYIP